MPDPASLYVYWIDNATRRGDSPVKHSLPFDDIRQARAWAKGKVDNGHATFAVVVSFRDDPTGEWLNIYPKAARRVVEHFEEIEARAAKGPPR